MESFLKSKHSSKGFLQKLWNFLGLVKNPKQRFRFNANLSKSKHFEATVIRETNEYKFAFLFLLDEHQLIEDEHQLIQDEHQLIQGEHQLIQDEHQLIQGEHQLIQDEHQLIQGEHQLIQGEHRTTATCEQSFSLLATENVYWLILFTSIVIEGLSALFEQLDYAMLGMLMAIFGLLISTAEFAYGVHIEQVTVEWRGMLPLLYSRYPTHKPFGSTMLYFGLVAAIWQCIHASVGYIYARKGAENPIKMTITMFLFCACLVVSKFVNKYSIRIHQTVSKMSV